MNIFSGNSLWQLVAQSDAVSKSVLLVLFCMSVACWAVFIGKLALLYVKERQCTDTNKKLQRAKNVSDLVDVANASSKTISGYFISKNLTFLKEILQTSSLYTGSPMQSNEIVAKNLQQKINPFEWEMLERNIDNTLDSLAMHNEEYLSILSSSAAVGPLLGLFGTIWGLIHSFMRISETQIADIATIAPGIAEALITTIAGLIVAIPALVMFNYLHAKSRKIEHHLIAIADRMTYILQQLRER